MIMKKLLILLVLLLGGISINAQVLVIDEKGNPYLEMTIPTTGLTKMQAFSALENLYVCKVVDVLDYVNHNAGFIAFSCYNEYPLAGGNGTTQAIITAKCFVKEGKIKVVFDDFKEKSSSRYGTSIKPLISNRNPLDDWRKGILQRVVSEMSDNIKNSIEKAKLYWKF